MQKQIKKGVMSEVIGVFVLVLVVAVLAGMTFMFVGSLKTQAYANDKVAQSGSNSNEAYTPSDTGQHLAAWGLDAVSCTITSVNNNSQAGLVIGAGNYTQNPTCNLINTSSQYVTAGWKVNYTYTYTTMGQASQAVNATENAGVTVVNYLPLLFLAIIFGAILSVVLKIILPYINLGNQVGGF